MEDFYANVYLENCNSFPADRLIPYRGKHVAWSMDGKEIVASADSHEELAARIKELGRRDIVRSYIDPDPVIVPANSIALDPAISHESVDSVAKP